MSASWLFTFGYSALLLTLLVGVALWRKHHRENRAPFPESARLLRGPGETLRRRLAALDDQIIRQLLFAFLVPLALGGALAWIATHFSGPAQIAWLLAAAAALLCSLVIGIRNLVATTDRWCNTWLGQFGERIVAEALEPLKADGFRIFHDVPAGDAAASFNIDHVVVGPTGVFAIETKTRRKGRARAGFAESQIIYDGRALAYPWGEDRHGLDQARRHATWLRESLEPLLGRPVPVHPILAFPGWHVITRAPGDVTVLNPRQIPATITALATDESALDPSQFELIVRHLDARCRDVDF